MKVHVAALSLFLAASLHAQLAISKHTPNTVRDAYVADNKHHNNQRSTHETHVLKGERTLKRYTGTKIEAEASLKRPQNKHWTTQTKGRPPSSETAQKNLGLKDKPKYVATIKANDVTVLGNGHDKVRGGKKNAPEAVIAGKPKVTSAEIHNVSTAKK